MKAHKFGTKEDQVQKVGIGTSSLFLSHRASAHLVCASQVKHAIEVDHEPFTLPLPARQVLSDHWCSAGFFFCLAFRKKVLPSNRKFQSCPQSPRDLLLVDLEPSGSVLLVEALARSPPTTQAAGLPPAAASVRHSVIRSHQTLHT